MILHKNYYSVTSYICICYKLYIIKVNRGSVLKKHKRRTFSYLNKTNYILTNRQTMY